MCLVALPLGEREPDGSRDPEQHGPERVVVDAECLEGRIHSGYFYSSVTELDPQHHEAGRNHSSPHSVLLKRHPSANENADRPF